MPVLQRLAEGFERAAVELGELVEKEHATVGQRSGMYPEAALLLFAQSVSRANLILVKPQRPTSRRAACRDELCARLGYCGSNDRYSTADDLTGETANAVVDAVLVAEGLNPVTADSGQRAQIKTIVNDWLFDPYGRGARSRLPW